MSDPQAGTTLLPVLPEVRRDLGTRRVYAADASMYEEIPSGVAFPRSEAELRGVVLEAGRSGVPLTPRTAGTSLAGQATGGGIIVDTARHLNRILSIDPEARTARVEPGVIRDTLNREAGSFGLQFGPDTSTTNRCMIGGMIGNNSAGSFSILHGTTREHVLEIDAILSDGSEVRFGPLTPAELDAKCALPTLEGAIHRGMVDLLRTHRDAILASYPHPEIRRRNTGYALDLLARMDPITPGGPPFNLCSLLCGSEGTLALTASALVRLVPLPKAKALVVAQFRTVLDAARATVEAVSLGPSAVEIVDDPILQATKGNLEQRRNRFFLEGDPGAILIIEFQGEDPEEVREKAEGTASLLRARGLGYAHPVIADADGMRRVWELRKAGLGLLMGLGADGRTPSFVEDTAVRVEDLPAYLEEFEGILQRYGTPCVFYGHASVGELHLRPSIDLTRTGGIETMKGIGDEVALLVRKYRGSLSGEHGDGRARAPWIETVLGPEMMPLLRAVKRLWDPAGILNPGKIVDPGPIEVGLRFSPAYRPPEVETAFAWRESGGFAGAVEACNGAGVCRKLAESGGTMCPSYQVTREERDSTRGRANLFRQLFSGAQADAFSSEELREALDLCLSCKGCRSECPANVDMARMKAEFQHGWHARRGISLADRFFGEPERLYPLAAALPGLSNALLEGGPFRWGLERWAGVDRGRPLPRFAPRSFRAGMGRPGGGPEVAAPSAVRDRRDPARLDPDPRNPARGDAERGEVALLVDLFTDVHEPHVAKAAFRVLTRLGYRVRVPEVRTLGRPAISRGLLDRARTHLERAWEELGPLAEAGIPIVGIEPSELLTLRDESLDLVPTSGLPRARRIAEGSRLFEEFLLEHLDRYPEDARGEMRSALEAGEAPEGPRREIGVAVHGHCHAKALVGNDPLLEMLRRVGFQPRDLRTGCCGMAGSFGYDRKKAALSMEIGELVLFPGVRSMDAGERLCAPGFSCRHQIADGTGRAALHPAELVAEAWSLT